MAVRLIEENVVKDIIARAPQPLLLCSSATLR